MKAIVTGGSGFIGTNLIKNLKGRGWEVLSIDIEHPRNMDDFDVYYKCDILDKVSLVEVFNEFKPDYIFHLAARTDLEGKAPSDYSVNTVGVENVCQASYQLSPKIKLLAASSMLVCKAGYIPNSIEDVCPNTVYGESKVVSENILTSWKNKMPNIVIIRPTSIWGPWFSTPYKDFFDMVLAGRFFHIGNSSGTKTYGYVENSVLQIISLALAQTSHLKHDYYYIGDPEPLNISGWADKIARTGGIKKIRTLPYYLFYLGALLGDVFKLFGIGFPLTRFRLSNMTTNNIYDCEPVQSLVTDRCVDLEPAITNTLNWLNQSK